MVNFGLQQSFVFKSDSSVKCGFINTGLPETVLWSLHLYLRKSEVITCPTSAFTAYEARSDGENHDKLGVGEASAPRWAKEEYVEDEDSARFDDKRDRLCLHRVLHSEVSISFTNQRDAFE